MALTNIHLTYSVRSLKGGEGGGSVTPGVRLILLDGQVISYCQQRRASVEWLSIVKRDWA
jgi:hypothetical protein